MILKCCLLVSVYFVLCHGFLLDDRSTTQTTIVSGTADHRYDALFNLLLTEREGRVKLEKEVNLLRKELLVTQQGVMDIYHLHSKLNETHKQQTVALESLDTKYINLQNQYDSLLNDTNLVKVNYEICLNMTNSLQNEMNSVKQLQSVADLQSVLALQHQTKIIEKQVEATNSQLSQITNDVNARKQDFIALFNKADATEKNMNESKNALKLELKTLQTQQHLQQNQLQMSVNSTAQHLEQRLGDLQRQFSKQPNRVALTVCPATERTYTYDSPIQFSLIKTRRGISNTVSSNLANTGAFICEKAGLYLISVFITSNTNGGYICLRKNGSVIIARMIFSMTTYHQTNSATVIYNLSVNDQITVAPCNTDQLVASTPYSCMTILQLSE